MFLIKNESLIAEPLIIWQVIQSYFIIIIYKLTSGSKKVYVVDGTRVPIAGHDNVSLISKYFAHDILYVPDFPLNLFSIIRIIKNLNGEFSVNQCVMQDLLIGRSIEISLVGGIYKLASTMESALVSGIQHKKNNQVTVQIIQQWHKRLEHIHFFVLSVMFSHLFKEISLGSLYCELCQMAKQIRSLYPIGWSFIQRYKNVKLWWMQRWICWLLSGKGSDLVYNMQ